jgi:hypothetical protein
LLLIFAEDGVLDDEEYKNFWYDVGGIDTDPTIVTQCMDTMTQVSYLEHIIPDIIWF